MFTLISIGWHSTKSAKKGTEKGAEKGTEKGTEKGAKKGAKKGTEKSTEKSTEKGTEKGTKKSTKKGAKKGTEKGTEKGTKKGARKYQAWIQWNDHQTEIVIPLTFSSKSWTKLREQLVEEQTFNLGKGRNTFSVVDQGKVWVIRLRLEKRQPSMDLRGSLGPDDRVALVEMIDQIINFARKSADAIKNPIKKQPNKCSSKELN